MDVVHLMLLYQLDLLTSNTIGHITEIEVAHLSKKAEIFIFLRTNSTKVYQKSNIA